MFFIAALLSFGWPKLDVTFGPPKEAELGTFKRVSLCCNSMAPAIRNGSVLHFAPWDGKSPLLGKIVDTGEVLHQVVAENKREVKTSGLANKHSDSWVPKEKIRFVVVYVERP